MSNREYLTIAKFSEKAGVSKQAIYKQVNNQNSQLAPFVLRDGKKLLISISALSALYGVETEELTETTPKETPTTQNSTNDNPVKVEIPTEEKQPSQPKNQVSTQDFQPISTDYIDFLKAQIAELKAEKREIESRLNNTIQEKDNIIKDQSAQLAKLAQQVADIANKAITTTSQQQLLTAVEKAEKQEPIADEIIEEKVVSPKKKKRFIDIFFR